MIDRSLMVTILTVLDERRDFPGGTEETALFDEINLRAIHAVTTSLLLEHLNLAADKQWVSWKPDMLRAKRYSITAAGRSALNELKDNN